MRRLASLAFALLASLSLAAYDFTQAGYALSGTKEVDGQSYSVLSEASGSQILFAGDAEPDDRRVAAMKSLVASLRSWKSLQPSEIRAFNFQDRLELVVIPAQFRREGLDLGPALPSGLQFVYNGRTFYDFKVKSGQFVVRVRGLYTGEDDLLSVVMAAYRDPGLFGESTDPVALLKRITDLEERAARDEGSLMAALNGGRPLNAAAVARLTELKRADPGLDKTRAAARLRELKLPLSSREIDIVFLVLFPVVAAP